MENNNIENNQESKNGNFAQKLGKIGGWDLLNEIQENRFVIASKSENRDIDKAMGVINKISSEEDKLREQDIVKDEIIASRGVRSVTSPELTAIQGVIDSLNDDLNETPQAQENKQSEKGQELVKSITSVSKQPRVEQPHQQIVAKPVVVQKSNVLQQNRESLLDGLKNNNGNNVFVTLGNIFLALFMTWFVTQKVPFISEQLARETTIMNLFYEFVFYFACLFSLFFVQIIGINIISFMKKNSILSNKTKAI